MTPYKIALHYSLKTPLGRSNIEKALRGYYKKLIDVQSADTTISAITGLGLLLVGAGVPYSLILTLCIDTFWVGSIRLPKGDVYQQDLALLVNIYSCWLNLEGATITADELFLEVMEAIAPCLTKEQGKDILTPNSLREQYADVSPQFKAILAKAPHSREIELVSLPRKKGWLNWMMNTESKSTVSSFSTEQKKMEPTPSHSLTENIHASAVWCKLYGYKPKPKAVDSKPSLDLKGAVSSIKNIALQQLAKT